MLTKKTFADMKRKIGIIGGRLILYLFLHFYLNANNICRYEKVGVGIGLILFFKGHLF